VAYPLRNSDSDSDSQKVFLGTSVVSGTATALVTATGKNTVFGDIATRLARRAPETEFERGTRRFGLNNEDHDLACVIRHPDQHSFSSTLS